MHAIIFLNNIKLDVYILNHNHIVYMPLLHTQSATDDEVKSVSTHEQFSVALGEEAVGVLATILLKLLDCVRSDSVEICSKKGDLKENPYNPNEPDEFRELGSSILRCCDVFMVRNHQFPNYNHRGAYSYYVMFSHLS